jgi:AbrB family looped-hinge helix DNA binding protein
MTGYRIPKAKGVRARETAPKYNVLPPYEPIPIPPVYHVVVAERGRLVLPAELRERLNIEDGDRVSLTLEDDGAVTLQTREVALRRLRGMFKHLEKPGERASDRLIAERRREARMEEREFRERTALHKRMKRERAKQR